MPRPCAALVDDLRQKLIAEDRTGRRGDGARHSHTARGKLLPRERVAPLLDPGSPFLELSQLAAYRDVSTSDVPAAGIITGIGRVQGARMRDRRQRRDGQGRHLLPDDGEEASARAGDRRSRTACPASIWSIPAAPTCPSQDEVFPDREHFGRIFYNQANMSAAGHPADRRGDGLVHRGRRLCAGDVATRRSSCETRARSSSAARRW